MKRNIISIVLSLVILIPALITSYITFTSIRSEIKLNLFGKITTAEVIATRIRPITAEKIIYELQYAFFIDDQKYPLPTDDNEDNDDENWASLPKQQWESAKESGKVEILFLPADPTNNHPVFSDGSFFYEMAITLIVLLVISIGCGLSINHQLKIINSRVHTDKQRQ
ncbi:MAG: hypothetical protein PF637_12635 [Spirochaetes bacterium]|jgi:hypothetical protein|nr:hypothetical protein [Spirochaetota bacterium]